MITTVAAARPTFPMDPNDGSFASGPIAQPAATGSSESPIEVITVPVTTGGKNRSTIANSGTRKMPITDDAITAPITAWMPPSPWIASMVAMPENETPCTSGSLDPKNGMPSVCSSVASPPMNREQATSIPRSVCDIPAA